MPFLSRKYINKKGNFFFGSYLINIKDRHLVYKFFDTSQGGYHPQKEPVVNISNLKSIEGNMVKKNVGSVRLNITM